MGEYAYSGYQKAKDTAKAMESVSEFVEAVFARWGEHWESTVSAGVTYRALGEHLESTLRTLGEL